MRKLFTLIIMAVMAVPTMLAGSGRTLQEMRAREARGEFVRETNPSVKFRARKGAENALPHAITPTSQHPNTLTSQHPKALAPSHPRSIAPEGGNIYGYLNFTTDDASLPGLYEITRTGSEIFWEDPCWDNYQQASDGWREDNKICGYILDLFMGYFWGYFYFEIDFETGDLLKLEEYPLEDLTAMFYIAQLQPTTGRVFGYVTTPDGIFFARTGATDRSEAIPIRAADEDYCYSFCFNPADKQFYGVNIKQEFVRVAEDGTQTVISRVPSTSEDPFGTFFTGLIWSPDANVFYWNSNMDVEVYRGDAMSRLYSITADGQFKQLLVFPNEEEFTYFITPDDVPEAGVPMRPTVVSSSFPQGALSGTVTFALPATFGDGAALPASVSYTIYLDDDVYSSGTAAPGSEVAAHYNDVERGTHSFGMGVTVNGKSSSKAFTRFFVGCDTPLAPANVAMTKTLVTWDAVTEGIHGGYVDASAVTYQVELNGQILGTTSETRYAITLPEDEPVTNYWATVTAIAAGYESEPASSNKVIAGEAYEVPMYLLPTQDEFDLMTVVDANRDNSSWRFEDDALFVSFTLDEDAPMNDYLYLPPVRITDTSKYYTFSLEAGLRHPSSPDEYLEVGYGTSPSVAGNRGVFIRRFSPTAVAGFYGDGDFQTFSGVLKVDEPGTYYIYLHCVSDGFQTGLVVRNLSLIDDNIVVDSPLAVTDLEAVPFGTGELKATLTFTLPTETMGGTVLPADAVLTARAFATGNEANAVTATGTPGSKLNMVVPTLQGENEMNVQVSWQGANSVVANTMVYCGVSVPATPENFRVVAAPDMMSARLTWDAVTEADVEGGYINPATVTYTLLTLNTNWNKWSIYLEGLTGTSYDFILDETSKQNQYVFGIAAVNEAGDNGYINYGAAFLGAPYRLPFEEEMNAYGFTTQPWFIYDEFDGEKYDAEYGRFFLSEVSDLYPNSLDVVLVGMSESPDGRGMLSIPRFSTKGEGSVTVSVDMLKGASTSSDAFYGTFYGNDSLIELDFIDGNTADDELQTFSFQLPEELLGKDWVQIYIESNFQSPSDMFVMSALRITGDSGVTLLELGKGAILGGRGEIIVNGLDGESVVIADMEGRVVCRGRIAGEAASYAVAPGVYAVTAGKRSAKVVVR